MKNISICIPTYNRAEKLAQCLEHLCGFVDQDFEIIVGNNASSDSTDAVVEAFQGRLHHLLYLRHRQNLGFARNMDALLQRASRGYLYILNDDDVVFENALDLAIGLMDNDPELVAVVGGYLSVRTLNPKLRVEYDDAVATTVPKGAYEALLGNLVLCDGHPIMRRDVFQRHCAYLDRTGTLIPLYFRLLGLGKVIAVDKPFFQHRTTGESLTARMADAWFLDMANADLELAVREALDFLPPHALVTARQRLLQTLYFQAARMSVARSQPYLLWLFLSRAAAIGALPPDAALKSEYHFSHEMAWERWLQRFEDGQYVRVHVLQGSRAQRWLRSQAQAWEIREHRYPPTTGLTSQDIALLDCGEECQNWAFAGCRAVAVEDLLARVRLTREHYQWDTHQGRLCLEYTDPATRAALLQVSPAFNVLCSPYSDI